MSQGKAVKLDYRCPGQGCEEKKACRRFLYGPEAKNSLVPFAAFDVRDRDGSGCGGFLKRVPHNAEITGAL